MPSLYIYFVSSLPMLSFTAKPPFSFERFISQCKDLLPQQDLLVLEGLISESPEALKNPVVKEWVRYNVLIANELVKIRALRKKVDPEKYIRADGFSGPEYTHIALAAHRNPSPLEGERFLDSERWKFLDALSFGHYFDLGFIITYAYKLLILERWERIFSADKDRLLEAALLHKE